MKGKHFWNTAPTPREIGILQPDASNFFGHELSIGFDVSPLSDFSIEGIMGGVFGNSTGNVLFFSEIAVYIRI